MNKSYLYVKPMIAGFRISSKCHDILMELSEETRTPVTRIAAAILEKVLVEKLIDLKVVNPIRIISKEGVK